MADNGRRHALIIGVSEYREKQRIKNLTGPANDAVALGQLLASSTPAYHVSLLVCGGDATAQDQPTFTAITASVDTVLRDAQESDAVLLYFAGHGHEAGDDTFLLPADARCASLTKTGLSLRQLKSELEDCRARNKVVVVDACFADARRASGDGAGNPIARALDSESFVTICATSAGQAAWESDATNHGVFTYALLDGLRGAAAIEGQVTVSGLYGYVTRQVAQWADSTGRDQTPTIEHHGQGDFVIVYAPPLVVEQEAAAALADPWAHFDRITFSFSESTIDDTDSEGEVKRRAGSLCASLGACPTNVFCVC